jgi:dTDP-glucose 4,6-dehydratase
VRAGLAATIDWYREHEDWWQVDKSLAEERYARLGR